MEQEERIAEDQDGLLEPTPHDDIQAAAQALELSQSYDPARCLRRNSLIFTVLGKCLY